MGHPLNRLDFNMTLGTNSVKQLFYTRENGEDLVCMRLQTATTRTRIRMTLNELQTNPRSEFKKPDDVNDWLSVIYMGHELREGQGEEIMHVLNLHKISNNPSFVESVSMNHRHLTNMLTDGLRMTRAAVVIPPRVVPPRAEPAVAVVPPRAEPAVAVVPPRDEPAELAIPPIAAVAPERYPDTVRPIVELARIVLNTIVSVIPIPANRVGVLVNMVAHVRTELERQAAGN